MLKTITLSKHIRLKYLILNLNHFIISPFQTYFFLPCKFFFSIKNKLIYFCDYNDLEKNSEVRFVRWLKHSTRLYKCKLILQGLGFKAYLNKEQGLIEFKLGFSHTIIIKIPKFLSINIEKSILSVTSVNPLLLGNFIYKLRLLKKLNIYKGKGIIYTNEIFVLKEIKKT